MRGDLPSPPKQKCNIRFSAVTPWSIFHFSLINNRVYNALVAKVMAHFSANRTKDGTPHALYRQGDLFLLV